MTLYFYNAGEIDIRGATIMGLHAKFDSDSAIGFFGTGLKYSIASILRWGGSIQIYSGETVFCFGADELNFRGKSFRQISMSENLLRSERLGFTTEYGKSWEPWQVFRELYANARDEGGGVSMHRAHPGVGRTVIEVTCPRVEAEFENRNDIILPRESSWDFVCKEAELRNKPSIYVYYRGVRVHGRMTQLTYNLRDGVKLTEDRTLADCWQLGMKVAEILSSCTHRSSILAALSAPAPTLEETCSFQPYWDYTEEFLDVAGELYRQDPSGNKRLKEVLEKHRSDLIESCETPVALTPVQQKMLNRAINLVDRMGMPASSTRIIVLELGSSCLGQYRASTGHVYLDPKVFDQGTKQVVSTLYEEMLHKTTGLEDECYEMQTHLFNTIVSLYEEHVFQEPC